MRPKVVFLALFLANVELLFAFRYPQYEEHPVPSRRLSAPSEIDSNQSIVNYKSHPPFGSLNKNKGDTQFGDWLKKKFNLFEGNSDLRRFQKATSNSLRRKNFDEQEDDTNVRKKCVRTNVKETEKEKEKQTETQLEKDTEKSKVKAKDKQMRRTEDEHNTDAGDLNLKELDRRIQQLIHIRTLRKFQKALDGIFEDSKDIEPKRRVNDESNGESSSSTSNDDANDNSNFSEDGNNEDSEGSGEDDNDNEIV